ncbi:NAD-dependent protein deacylase SIR4 [Penicillium taxi]|uniref:NAD-dependent protein deacylase SIR4 n=1 Tax=Penicillium taxi TaxID=168475 RepID=UPI00254539F3|nr:NAD-dependent protein deacylase SIR4 [Penicillium taxi]KAJ5908031.1 NAD-dependent protein deacylase SIR4 [Penicillium taxi]
MRPTIRIPFTSPFPPAIIAPKSAQSAEGAIDAVINFLTARAPQKLEGANLHKTVVLTGAGVSVASGLSDYRGEDGVYRKNQQYRPIYYHEFASKHISRQRYWSRSFVGWPGFQNAKPNSIHRVIKALHDKGYISSIVTQNVDSFHSNLEIPVVELHGYLREVVCIHCRKHILRDWFQSQLKELNPDWARFLKRMIEAGALDARNTDKQIQLGLKLNPDGDVDLPGAPYGTFRYPACPTCLNSPPTLKDGTTAHVEVDDDGAWMPTSNAGILKPAVIMFGESIDPLTKQRAEEAIDGAGRLLILGSSLATLSAWRLVERAHQRGMAIGVINVGGIRNEKTIFGSKDETSHVRINQPLEQILPTVCDRLQ